MTPTRFQIGQFLVILGLITLGFMVLTIRLIRASRCAF